MSASLASASTFPIWQVPGNSRNPKEDTLWSADFSLDDCLRQRAAGMTRIELEGVPFQLNPLLDLINEKFMVR